MPGKKKILYTNGVYHVFNKTINSFGIFENNYNTELFLKLIEYYRSLKATASFSSLGHLQPTAKKAILRKVTYAKYFKVKILSYCLMPTHYHLLIQQLIDNGASKFISDTTNAFTRHLNEKNNRLGPIFLTGFKSVQILTDEQLMHVSRYIHLNPYSNMIIDKLEGLLDYPWSSYGEYIARGKGLCETNPVLSLFNDSKSRYKDFVESHADYQRTLEFAKHAERWI